MDEIPELNQLVRELNEGRSAESTEPRDTMQLDQWLRTLVSQGGSDLLLVAGAPLCIRVQGEVRRLDSSPVDGADIEAAVMPALSRHALRVYRESGIADSSYRISGVGRFRVNIHRERGRTAAAIRALPARVPALQELHLPTAVANLARLPRGLVLIGGPAGSGKSTTLSALIHEMNTREARHILTIEDPIEYEHTHNRSVIEQVEIGTDAPDFPTALRAALRRPRTSSWSARCATRKPCVSLCLQRRPVIWYSRHFTQQTSLPPWLALWTRSPSNDKVRFARSWRWLWQRC